MKPPEISEILTDLAFYSGWANAMSGAAVAKDVFAERNIGADQLPAAAPTILAIDNDADAKRAANVEQQFGKVAPGLVQHNEVLLLRPDLAPRDRSLVTVSVLIASGQVAQVTYHLNRAIDNGLTREQAGEVVTHLAFYPGWPNAFSALPVGCLRETPALELQTSAVLGQGPRHCFQPTTQPTIVWSCAAWRYFGSPRAIVSCCKTNPRYADKGEVGGSSPPRPTIILQ